MDRRESEALDRHITGNYGEDQLTAWEEFSNWDEPDCQVSNCDEPAEDGVLCERHLKEQGNQR